MRVFMGIYITKFHPQPAPVSLRELSMSWEGGLGQSMLSDTCSMLGIGEIIEVLIVFLR
jgi:hypothetical protein